VLNDAWKRSFDWAVYLWLAMVTGCRRGELCGLLWCDVDFDSRVLSVAFSEQQLRGRRRRKDTKTRQKRRISFDRDTEQLMLALHADTVERCTALSLTLSENAYVFSYQPDGCEPWKPSTVSQRYGCTARRLKLSSTRLHSLRHYSATELIAAGVDLRTVAGRLGHGSGGVTTLRITPPGAPERTNAPPPSSAGNYLGPAERPTLPQSPSMAWRWPAPAATPRPGPACTPKTGTSAPAAATVARWSTPSTRTRRSRMPSRNPKNRIARIA
jgi:integrase